MRRRAGATAADFDADIAIATGELRQLLPALVDALGGWQEPGAAAAAPAGSTAAAGTANDAAATPPAAGGQAGASTPPWDVVAA